MKYLKLVFVLVFFSNCSQKDIENTEQSAINYFEQGFTALYEDDLSQWETQIAENPKRIPKIMDGLSDEERQQKLDSLRQETFRHWYIQDGMLLYDGTRKIENIETKKEYGDFELVLDWKIGPTGDSGIFLRGMPQVQIWDPHHQGVGSGGLHNNKPRVNPLTTADKPVGEWNTMHMRIVGDSVWVTLNDKLVVDGAIQQNAWAGYEQPAPPRGKIVLQSHGTPLWFRNIFIKEL